MHEAGEQAHGIGAAAHAGHGHVGQTAGKFQHLGAGFAADDGLEVAHHERVGVRAHGGTQHIEGLGLVDPHLQGFVHGFLEGTLAAHGRMHAGAQHLHAGHVEVLADDVHFTHADDAFQAHEGGTGRGAHAMLARAGLGDDTGLAHALGQQTLADGVVDLVGAQMVEVFALEPDLRAAQLLAEVAAVEDRAGTTGKVQQQALHLLREFGVGQGFLEGLVQFVQAGLDGIGHILAAVRTKEALAVRLAEGFDIFAHDRSFTHAAACGCFSIGSYLHYAVRWRASRKHAGCPFLHGFRKSGGRLRHRTFSCRFTFHFTGGAHAG